MTRLFLASMTRLASAIAVRASRGTDEDLHKACKAGECAQWAEQVQHQKTRADSCSNARYRRPVIGLVQVRRRTRRSGPGQATKNAVNQYKELQDILGDL